MGIKFKSILGALATYTAYTGYSYSLTQREIKLREIEIDGKSKGNDIEDIRRWEIFKVGERFENPFSEYRPQTLYEFFIMRVIELFDIWKLKEAKGGVPFNIEKVKQSLGWVNFQETEEEIADGLKFTELYRDKIVNDGYIGFTWFGQSCSLIESGDRKMVTDPLFEDWIVNSKIGPKRIVPCPTKKLSDIDWVFVSHDHPDHLGEDSVKMLQNDKTKWIVPVGIKSFLVNLGIRESNIREMKWWDKFQLDDNFEVVCLPAMHWSGRLLYDSNLSLWCSFLILKNGKGLFYHGGDTGYVNKLFKQIGDIYGPIKLSALPIGQYCPEWHQKPRHISPRESVKIMQEMGIHKLVGVHWGTFVLSSEHYLEPKQLLEKEATKEGKVNNIVIPKPGQRMLMKEDKLDFENDDEVEFVNDRLVIYK